MPILAVTGASGRLGRLALAQLLAHDVPPASIVAVVRNTNNARDLTDHGVQLREADYSRPATLIGALTGVDRLLLISSSGATQRLPHHVAVIEAAETVGVSSIVYTSMLNADHSTNALAADHLGTELRLRHSGIPFTLLRNGWYTENYTEQLEKYLAQGVIAGSAGSGRISAASRSDLAAAGAAALLREDGERRTYELGGPAFTLAGLAEVITEAMGTRVIYRDMPVEEYVSELLTTGLDPATARFVARLDESIAHDDLYTSRADLEDLLGRPPMGPADVLRLA